MIKLNKYQSAQVIKKCRPGITENTIKVKIRDLVIKNHQFNELFFWQLSVNAVLNEDPLPWE